MPYKNKKLNCWVASFSIEGKRRRKHGFKTKKEAVEYENDCIRESSLNNNILDNNELLLIDLINIYLDNIRPSIKNTTYKKYVDTFKLLKPLERKKVCLLTSKDILVWRSDMIKKEYSASYINYAKQKLSTLLEYAMKEYDLDKNVTKIVANIKDSSITEKSYFTLEEYLKFENVIEDLVYKSFFNFLYFTGCRKGEAIALQWKDINFENKTVYIYKTLSPKKSQKGKGSNVFEITTPKTKSSIRTLDLVDSSVEYLLELRKYYEQLKGFNDGMFVFGAIKPLKESTIQRRKDLYCEKAGVDIIKVHDFRHSNASLLINNGANPLLVAKRLGHSDVSMTFNTYAHMFENTEKTVVNLINIIVTKKL